MSCDKDTINYQYLIPSKNYYPNWSVR